MIKKDENLRILQTVYCLGRGGAERLAIDITNELNRRKNVEALLISFNHSADYEYSTDNVNYKYCHSTVDLSIIGKNHISLENYKNVIDEFKPHIIHSHRYLTEVITRELIFPEIAYFTHIHDNIEQFQKFTFRSLFNKSKLIFLYEKYRILKRYKKCNNNFIAISRDAYNYAYKTLPKSLQKIRLIFNAIDFQQFNSYYRNRIINKEDKIKLVSIGNLLDKKNQVFFIDIVKKLTASGYDVTVDLLGAGPNLEMLKNKVKKEKLEDKIFLRGNVSNVGDYLNSSHIYVHSALYEPFGLVILEAMASGLPCVTLDGRGNRDIINDDGNGYIVYDMTADTFVRRIIELIENKNTYDRIVEASLKTAREHDISAYVDKLLDYYYSVMK